MGSADKIHIVLRKEPRDDVWPESERYTTVVLTPPRDILIGIRPQQVAKKTTIRNLYITYQLLTAREMSLQQTTTHICWAHDPTDLFHRIQVRAKTTVHGEDLLVDNGRNWQAVEAVGERLP